ncbi:hypothetical protein N9Z46_01505 [Akkermansiaceae bacterium]|nr:hypothetical protein [Akkermansiaceae bacterium]
MQDIEQIDWEMVLLADELRESASAWRKIVNLVRGIGGFFLRRSIPEVRVDSGTVLCVKSMARADYDAQWALTLNCIDEKKHAVLIEWKRGLSFDPIKRLKYLPLAWRAANKKKSLLDRLSGTVRSLYCMDAIHAFREVAPAKVLFFAEMRPAENVLVQFFNLKNIPTATLQHGLFIDYGAKKTVNRLNYEGSCAQAFLAWGEETGHLIQRFNPSVDVVICGALHIEGQPEEADPPCVYVVLDADINRHENEILLDVGRRLGRALSLEFVACCHPRNRTDWYDLEGYSPLPPRDEYSRKGYVLGHTTTQLLKLARLGKRVFKLKSAEPCNRMIPDAVSFSDFDELQSKINSGDYPFEWSYAHVACIGDDAQVRYSEFFNEWENGYKSPKASDK